MNPYKSFHINYTCSSYCFNHNSCINRLVYSNREGALSDRTECQLRNRSDLSLCSLPLLPSECTPRSNTKAYYHHHPIKILELFYELLQRRMGELPLSFTVFVLITLPTLSTKTDGMHQVVHDSDQRKQAKRARELASKQSEQASQRASDASNPPSEQARNGKARKRTS